MLVKSYHYSVQQQRIRLDNLEIKYLAIMNTPGWFHDANLARKHNYRILGYIGEAMVCLLLCYFRSDILTRFPSIPHIFMLTNLT